MDGQGSLERTWNIREKSGNLKWLLQSSKELYILFKRGQDVLSHKIV